MVMEEGHHRHNLGNALLAVCVPLPSFLFYTAILHACPLQPHGLWQRVCSFSSQHPLALINLLFFFNVDLLFWIISLVQQSTWLIDPYWTVLPVLIAHFYAAHPLARADPWRSRVVLILTWVWSIRLTHSYFRRENWQWGLREDWRFAKMRRENPKHWWWLSFFVVYVSQHCFLFGICLPIFTIHNNQTPWCTSDVIAMMICAMGISIGYVSDTQLHHYVSKNHLLKGIGAPTVPVLDEGLWHYSRHPNYFGEQLWWWGLAGFSWIVGQGWATIGTVINSAVLVQVTLFVEERMLSDGSRAEAYRKYQQRTSVWIPWFTQKCKAQNIKNKKVE